MTVMCINSNGWKLLKTDINRPGPKYGDFCTVGALLSVEGVSVYMLLEWDGLWICEEFIPVQDQPVECEQVSVEEPALV
jgi:hypothetical protein